MKNTALQIAVHQFLEWQKTHRIFDEVSAEGPFEDRRYVAVGSQSSALLGHLAELEKTLADPTYQNQLYP